MNDLLISPPIIKKKGLGRVRSREQRYYQQIDGRINYKIDVH